ncbi:hypothetical protein FQR65_LT17610 [Abscondita terminalis]|nr:hypothetical protein FQR65_LT17610 [Abscondita terminalis]
MENKNTKVIDIDIKNEVERNFLEYSMSVIVSRALPDLRDGLKPVQRRIVYAMNDLNIIHSTPHKKSARIVGEVIGKYHPHGDSSVYEAMVRMSQDFSYRYPLVDGHGNFGSIDGDGAAAMRYTEARLSKISSLLLKDIDMETIPFVDNYDASEREPKFLPSYFPNLLVNGVTGIAVGMATSIPPHNLREVISATVAYVKNNEITIDEIINNHIQGPDFPTGASMTNGYNTKQGYLTGKGSTTIRAKIDIEENNKKFNIVITEIPYQVNKTRIIEKIVELYKNKIIVGIKDIRDESNYKGIRIVLELTSNSNPQLIIKRLYKYTSLQTNFSINMLSLNKNVPEVLNIKKIIKYYVEHQIEMIVKRSEFEKRKIERQLHILKALSIALENIDKVISVIKNSENNKDAQEKLNKEFNFDDAQSKAILEMRLQRLVGLEREKILNEIKEIEKRIIELTELIGNKNKQNEMLISELISVSDKFGDDRRTKIIKEELTEIEEEDLVNNNKILITLSKEGYLKKVDTEEFKTQKRGGKGVIYNSDSNDPIINSVIAKEKDEIMFFSNKGKVYKIKAYKLQKHSKNSKGHPIINSISISPDEKITSILNYKNKNDKYQYLMFITKKGIGKRVDLKEFESVNNQGKISISLDIGDELTSVIQTTGKNNVLVSTNDDFGNDTIVTVSQNGIIKRTKIEELELSSRATKDLNLTRKNIIQQVENFKAQKNQISKEVGEFMKAKKINDANILKSEVDTLNKKISELDLELNNVDKDINLALINLPNVVNENIPIATKLGLLDVEFGTKLSGSRFLTYTGKGAKIIRALADILIKEHEKRNYIEINVPLIVNKEAMFGTGQLPKFEEDAYKVDDQYLIPTSEVPLTNYISNKILEENELPIYLTAFTQCFRKEAGSAGRDTKGMIRLHQFNKVEMVKFCTPENSNQELEKMLLDAENILQIFNLPYRVVELCSETLISLQTNKDIIVSKENDQKNLGIVTPIKTLEYKLSDEEEKKIEENIKQSFIQNNEPKNMNEFLKIKLEQIIKENAVNMDEVVFNDDQILGILSSANKITREAIQNKFNNFFEVDENNNIKNINMTKKYVMFLENKVVAANENGCLIVCETRSNAKFINNKLKNEKFRNEFFEDIEMEIAILAIDKIKFKNIRKEYELQKNNNSLETLNRFNISEFYTDSNTKYFEIENENEYLKRLIDLLGKENVKFNDLCESCENPNRDITKICVVSNILDAKTIIDKEVYNGTFYILNGEININSGVLPENLNVDKLFDKIKVGNELLLALNTTFEGEVTSNYIANKLQVDENNNIKNINMTKKYVMFLENKVVAANENGCLIVCETRSNAKFINNKLKNEKFRNEFFEDIEMEIAILAIDKIKFKNIRKEYELQKNNNSLETLNRFNISEFYTDSNTKYFEIENENEYLKRLIDLLGKENVKFNDLCESCENPNRDITKICVVSNILDAKTIIDKEVYNGTFYILNGEININSGVLPENLNVDKLFDKIKVGNELLLALNTTFEGEVTSNYIANKLQGKNIKITRLAKGMPIGGVIDYIDKETLKSAFDYRKDFKEFRDSTSAYQGNARGLGIDSVDKIQNIILGELNPNLTLYLDISPIEANDRVKKRKRDSDRLDNEGIDFQNKVYEGYEILLEKHADRFKIINARQKLEKVAEDAYKIIKTFIEKRI